MNALLDKQCLLWQPVDASGSVGRAMQDCMPYAEMAYRVALRMTGDQEAAKTLFRATIYAYLTQDNNHAAAAQPVKFRLLSLLRQQYTQHILKGARTLS